MAKQDLLDEAEALGIEGLDDSFTNRMIQAEIDKARAELDSPEDPTEEDGHEDLESPVEEVVEQSEPVFTIAQLKPYAEGLFGVGYHVLVGAQSAGCFPPGKVTKDQVRHGIDQYLEMPVETSKEG